MVFVGLDITKVGMEKELKVQLLVLNFVFRIQNVSTRLSYWEELAQDIIVLSAL